MRRVAERQRRRIAVLTARRGPGRGRAAGDPALHEAEHQPAHIAVVVRAARIGARREQPRDGTVGRIQDPQIVVDLDPA